MNGAPLNGGTPRQFFTPIRMPGVEVSCVAPNPFRAGFSVGTDNGEVKFTDEGGAILGEMNGSPSGEAINGIASFANSIAVSSRQEVMLRTWAPENLKNLAVFKAPHGAHGVSATPGGYYVAPLGDAGIMMMKAGSGHGDPVGVMTTEKESMYFYRVLARRGRDGKDLLVCAARQGGIGIAEVRWGDNTFNMRTATFPELDVVDVCFVGGGPESPALAAVGRDGSLILVRDMLHDQKPVTMRFATVQGRAYRLLSARGHLFLLTSSALYGLMNLGNRLMRGLPSGKFTTPILTVQLKAVDASLIDDRWLPVVMPDEVLRFDLDLIDANIPEDIGDGEVRPATVKTDGVPNETGEHGAADEGIPMPTVEVFGETGEATERSWKVENIPTGSRDLAEVS
jgi:hypothetical protein